MKPENVDNWTPTYANGTASPFPKEETPYRECPNCGRNKFRYSYRLSHGIPFIGTTKHIFQEYCSNCKYSEEMEVREE